MIQLVRPIEPSNHLLHRFTNRFDSGNLGVDAITTKAVMWEVTAIHSSVWYVRILAIRVTHKQII